MRTQQWQWIEQAIIIPTGNCILWPFEKAVVRRNGGTYGRCSYGGAPVLAHRMAFFLEVGRWPHPCARHTCDVTLCVNPRHLIEGTQQQNIMDMITRNRKAVGVQMPNAKMTDALVRKLRAGYIPGKVGSKQLGIKYGIDRKNAYDIATRRAWKHVI